MLNILHREVYKHEAMETIWRGPSGGAGTERRHGNEGGRGGNRGRGGPGGAVRARDTLFNTWEKTGLGAGPVFPWNGDF